MVKRIKNIIQRNFRYLFGLLAMVGVPYLLGAVAYFEFSGNMELAFGVGIFGLLALFLCFMGLIWDLAPVRNEGS